MAQWHLNELRDSLERRGWRVIAEEAGDEYSISGTWVIQRSAQAEPLLIDFEGLDDMATLPLEQSYGCCVRGHSLEGLYFGKRGHQTSSQRGKWNKEVSRFVTHIDQLEKDR
jgi:hypothetical protein